MFKRIFLTDYFDIAILPNKDSELGPNIVSEEFVDAKKHLPKSMKTANWKEPEIQPALLDSMDALVIRKVNFMIEVRSFTPYLQFLNANISYVNLFTQTLLSACEEGEIKAMNILDRALKEKIDEDQTIIKIKEVMREYLIRFRMSGDKTVKELEMEECRMGHVTPEQIMMWMNYGKHIKSFIIEMLSFSFDMFIKIAAESFRNEIKKRNETSLFFRTTIQAFQQANMFELMSTVYKCSDDSSDAILKESLDEIESVTDRTLTTDSKVGPSFLCILFIFNLG